MQRFQVEQRLIDTRMLHAANTHRMGRRAIFVLIENYQLVNIPRQSYNETQERGDGLRG